MTQAAQPLATALSQPFWEQGREGQFLLQVSAATGRAQFFPRPRGLQHLEAVEWRPAIGTGVLLAFTVCRVAAPGYEADLPYAMGIVRLAEGPRLLARVVVPDTAVLKVGMPVRLGWDRTRGVQPIPVIEPA